MKIKNLEGEVLYFRGSILAAFKRGKGSFFIKVPSREGQTKSTLRLLSFYAKLSLKDVNLSRIITPNKLTTTTTIIKRITSILYQY